MRGIALGLSGGLLGALLAGCVSAPAPVQSQTTRVVVARPVALPPPPPLASRPPPPVSAPPEEAVVEAPSAFASVAGWSDVDARPALAAFRESCRIWRGAEAGDLLSPNLPQYGTFADWRPACRALDAETATTADGARRYFEAHFAPVELSTPTDETGLLTGYYEPEVAVRRVPDRVFSEPVLAKPETDALRLQARADIDETTSRVIAYGKPIDVFFMQIQGSGRLRFEDGLTIRAAFAGHNGEPYTSIGRKLVEWGEIEAGKASKRNIEVWMEKAGPLRTEALMNENRRYIFFEEQAIPREGGVAKGPHSSGPLGAMRVPLTDMGSMAVDPRYHPYGTLAVLETTLPQRARDFRGRPATLLVAAQDTGGAIKGPLRGDLFFGAGAGAGSLAGVMKHPVRWTLLLPKAIAGEAPAS